MPGGGEGFEPFVSGFGEWTGAAELLGGLGAGDLDPYPCFFQAEKLWLFTILVEQAEHR